MTLADLGPATHIEAIGGIVYPFQRYIYEHYKTPLMVVAARQVGKTHCFGGLAYHIAMTNPGSLSAIVCPDQDKSKTLIDRVRKVGQLESAQWSPDNTEELGLGKSRIVGLPGTVKGVVSRSAKLLVFDEAGLMLGQQGRDLYSAATPMQAAITDPLTFAISSAWWQEGWFWDEWSSTDSSYKKVLVLPRWTLSKNHREIIPVEMTDAELRNHWRARGVEAFYADTPSKTFMEKELTRHPEYQMRQQYLCEFLEKQSKVFQSVWFEKAVTDEIVPLFGSVEEAPREGSILADILK
jgi:hypothetical protein